MNILLVAATVLSFLSGGILRSDAHYNIVGEGNRGWALLISIAIGLTQSLPFIFVTYFELFYLPDRIKHPEKYEGFIKDDDGSHLGSDEDPDSVAEEMQKTKDEVSKEDDYQ